MNTTRIQTGLQRMATALAVLAGGALYPLESRAQDIFPSGGSFREHQRIWVGVNAIRANAHVPPFTVEDPKLKQAVSNYARFLAANHDKDGPPAIHTADGKTPQQRAADAGFKCSAAVVENIAAAWFSPPFRPPGCTGEACSNSHMATSKALDFWNNSPPHHAAMVNPAFTLTAIGVGGFRFGQEDFYIFVMNFSPPCP
jgi:uncharacterized protein YkwD